MKAWKTAKELLSRRTPSRQWCGNCVHKFADWCFDDPKCNRFDTQGRNCYKWKLDALGSSA